MRSGHADRSILVQAARSLAIRIRCFHVLAWFFLLDVPFIALCSFSVVSFAHVLDTGIKVVLCFVPRALPYYLLLLETPHVLISLLFLLSAKSCTDVDSRLYYISTMGRTLYLFF